MIVFFFCGLTPSPADSGSAARAQARFARNGAITGRSLANPAATAGPYRQPAKVVVTLISTPHSFF